MAIRTNSQKAAGRALGHIQEVKGKSWAKQYGRLWLRFPGLVLTNGLMQTVAFYESRNVPKHPEYGAFLGHMRGILEEGFGESNPLHTLSCPEYMRATRIALLAAVYYGRFCESILEVKRTDEGEER
ncbi:MAG: type III-B CRISPR module-associated protein Cmr5 [Candidatus Eisenbacteria bacterium]|nr:type III-B CRISPR module-associated protein Cmr5 [Candidatus Eisenbacteria bacterium]